MQILGIETSCDETAAAVVEKFHAGKSTKFAVYSALSSSQKTHVKSGGIVPEVAARKQIESIIPVIQEVITGKKVVDEIDAIAVTYGPGLIGSLLVGVETAKTLSLVWEKPIVPINHLVSHIYANWVDRKKEPEFPAVALVVSGGHTDFVLMKGHGDIDYLGGTRDDAAGEAFDKIARLLGLSYPGGPAIAKASVPFLKKQESMQIFPRPMLDSGNLDVSFSGLKTSVSNFIKQNKNFDVNQLAAEVQEAIVDTLVAKSRFAVKKYKPKSFLLGGGVSANARLREKIKEVLGKEVEVFIPEPQYSTDNAVMVAMAAHYNYHPVPWQKISADPSLSIEN